MFLVSYRSEIPQCGSVIYGYATVIDPIEWLLKMQKYTEIYIILNTEPITQSQLDKFGGWINGM